MGNREDLLDAATRCLYDKGYGRTTARDIASAAGVSLAAIGYHYGSKEALLNAAVERAMERWGDELAAVLGTVESSGPATGAERFVAAWDEVVRSFADGRPLWSVQFELLVAIDRDPALGAMFTAAQRQARLGLVELFGDFGIGADENRRLALGAFYQALLTGVAAQWLVDPATAPSGDDLLTAVRAAAA